MMGERGKGGRREQGEMEGERVFVKGERRGRKMKWEQAMSMEEIWKKRNRMGERGKERREEGIRRKVGGMVSVRGEKRV